MKNKKLNKNQFGFALVAEIGVALAVILVIGTVGLKIFNNNKKPASITKSVATNNTTSKTNAKTPINSTSSGSTTQNNPTSSTPKAPSSSKPKTSTSTSQTSPSTPTSTEPTVSIILPSNGATVGANPTFSVHSNAPNGYEQISVDITNTNMDCGGGSDDPKCYGYSYGSYDASDYPNLSFVWDTETDYPRYNNPFKVEATIEDKLGHKATATIVINLQR